MRLGGINSFAKRRNRLTHQSSERMVRHVSRGIAKGVGAAVAEDNRRPRGLHGDQHRGHGDVRQVHHHSQSIHLEDHALRTGPVRGDNWAKFRVRQEGFFFLSPSRFHRDNGTRELAGRFVPK